MESSSLVLGSYIRHTGFYCVLDVIWLLHISSKAIPFIVRGFGAECFCIVKTAPDDIFYIYRYNIILVGDDEKPEMLPLPAAAPHGWRIKCLSINFIRRNANSLGDAVKRYVYIMSVSDEVHRVGARYARYAHHVIRVYIGSEYFRRTRRRISWWQYA